MGLKFTKLLKSLFGHDEMRILMLGLDNAGKTSKNQQQQQKTSNTIQTKTKPKCSHNPHRRIQR